MNSVLKQLHYYFNQIRGNINISVHDSKNKYIYKISYYNEEIDFNSSIDIEKKYLDKAGFNNACVKVIIDNFNEDFINAIQNKQELV